jgi:replicative DNA helicase
MDDNQKHKEQMTLQDFQKTGMFVYRPDFERKHKPKQKLHSDCTDVLIYQGDFFIQCLKDNSFLLEIYDEAEPSEIITKIRSGKLETVESVLWQRHADNFINKKNEN